MAAYTPGQRISATYWTSVYKPNISGWKSEHVTAVLEVLSPGKAKVISAEMEPAASNRQRFNSSNAACKEIGTVKIISKLNDVKVIE